MASGSHLRCGGQDGDGQLAAVVSSRPNEKCSDRNNNEANITYCDQRQIRRNTQLYWLRYSRKCGQHFNGHAFL
eukprot:4579297-Heterocapsa_arctica.AAC.1